MSYIEERHNYCFYGIVGYQNKWKKRMDQVELLGLILIHIMNYKIVFSSIEEFKVPQILLVNISIPFSNLQCFSFTLNS